MAIDFPLDCLWWYTSFSKLKGIVTQKPDRATWTHQLVKEKKVKARMGLELKTFSPDSLGHLLGEAGRTLSFAYVTLFGAFCDLLGTVVFFRSWIYRYSKLNKTLKSHSSFFFRPKICSDSSKILISTSSGLREYLLS